MIEVACISSEALSSIKDVVLMGCAIIGTVVAVIGLNTWKKQLKWSHGSELKRKLLIELYRLQDSIEDIRTPEITRSINGEDSYTKRYVDGWNKIQEHRNILKSYIPEARATWDAGLRDIIDTLEEPLKKLHWAIHEQLEVRNPNIDKTTKAELQKGIKERSAIIFRRHKNDTHRTNDVLAENIKEITKSVENYLESRKT